MAGGTSTDQGATPSGEPPAAKKSWNRLLLPLIAAGVIAIAALVGVVTLSTARANETAELRKALEREQDRTESLSGQLETYKGRELDLVEREGAVETRETQLDRRETEISATEEQVAATTLKDGYVYTVGSTMEAGTYQANATGSSCYWKITVSGTNYSDIVENDLGSMGNLTVTVGAGQDFQSKECGDWTKVG
jgi:predicted RNase H-like nuclease (RuvC/YqgF family)